MALQHGHSTGSDLQQLLIQHSLIAQATTQGCAAHQQYTDERKGGGGKQSVRWGRGGETCVDSLEAEVP